uniref:Uncharacterized protein n=1 Tax=Picocystis salinarum TaxID=88271 RepID=A0A6U9RHF1_9CHLO
MAAVFSMAKLHVRASSSSSSSSSSWSNATKGDGRRVDGRTKTPLRRTYYAERCALAVQGALGEVEATHLVQCAAMQDVSERMRRMESGAGSKEGQQSSDEDWEGFACTWRIQGRSPRATDAALSCATTVQVDAKRAVQYRKEAWKKCRNMGKENLHQMRAKLAYESSLVTLLQADEFECEFMSAQGDTRAIKGNEKLLEELVRAVAKHMAQGKTDRGEQVRVLAMRGGSKELAWRKQTDDWESMLLEEETWDDFIECLDMMLADSKTLPRLYLSPPTIQAPKRRFLRPWMQVGSFLVLLGFAGYRMLLPWLPSLPRGLPGESKLHSKAVAAGWPTRTVDLASLRGDTGEPLKVANGELTSEEMNSLCNEVQSQLLEKVNKTLKVNEFSASKVMLFQVVLDEKHQVVGYAPSSAAALSAWEELPFLHELGKSWSIARARYGERPKKAYVLKLAIKEDGSFQVTEWERDDSVVVDWSAQ